MSEPCGCSVQRDAAGYMFPALCPLHAAAPALLEALEGIVKVNTRIQEPSTFENVDDWIVVSRDAFDKARAAIAQAKGESK